VQPLLSPEVVFDWTWPGTTPTFFWENGLEMPGITAMDLGSMEKSSSSAASQGERIPVRNASAFSNSIPSQSAGFGGPLVGNPFSTWRFRWQQAV
jgi:hypothetical protein